jgi:hypothetical protein
MPTLSIMSGNVVDWMTVDMTADEVREELVKELRSTATNAFIWEVMAEYDALFDEKGFTFSLPNGRSEEMLTFIYIPDGVVMPRNVRNVFAMRAQAMALVMAVLENQEDEWFINRVTRSLATGFYWHESIRTEGWVNRRTESVWTDHTHPEAHERAWLMAALAYTNGHRRHERGY